MNERIRTQGDCPDTMFIVRTLPLGVGGLYFFEEDAQEEARRLREEGKRAYVVPRKPE